MNKLIFFLKYLKYKIFAKHKKGNSIHSPFLFEFVENTVNETVPYYAMDDIWNIRQDLAKDKRTISVHDLGAGSKVMKSSERKIADIAKHSGISEKFGEMLFRTTVRYQPQTIVELGTSLGLGTMYMAMADSRAKVYTIEGCPETADIAAENFLDMEIENIKISVGNIDTELPKVLESIEKVDLVYFDGNHQYEPTISYFNQCLEKAHSGTIFIFDDIHWSKGMEKAWSEIKLNERVKVTVDFFFSGYVFFNQDLSKQDFIVHF